MLEHTEDSRSWVLCHNSEDVFHISQLEAGDTIQTGQPELEVFQAEEDLENRLAELTDDPEYYSNWKQENGF